MQIRLAFSDWLSGFARHYRWSAPGASGKSVTQFVSTFGNRHTMSSGIRSFLLSGLLWLAILFTLLMALLPKPPDLPGNPSDKLQHVAAFATLTLFAILTYPRARYRRVFVAFACLGAMIELLQAIPILHRDAEFRDWLADCGAILFVLCLGHVWRSLLRWRAGQARKAKN